MLTFGLVVEGHDDEAVLKELIRKCVPSEVEVIGRKCGNKVALTKRFPKFLEEFRYSGLNFHKAIVIRDADGKDPVPLIKAMESKISNRGHPFPVKLLVIVQELEAWLLADGEAIAAVTNKKAPVVRYPERLSNPKEKLKNILSQARIAYTPEVARRIAVNANV